MNLDSNFDWANEWNTRPSRCIKLTQNAYDCILNTMQQEMIRNQATVKELLNMKTANVDEFNRSVEYGVKLKLSLQELKRIGDRHE